jgi:signal transduction histidine kinase
MGTSIEVADLATFHDQLLVQQGVTHAWREDVGVLALACAAALFVVAGVIRLARWRLAGDPHSALVGCAQIVMGGLFLPLLGVAEIGGALAHRDLGQTLIRALAYVVTAALVFRALRCTGMHGVERPSRLLPLLAAVVLAAFAALAAAEAALPQPAPHGREAAHTLSVAMTVGWLALASVVRTRGPGRPWSRRAAPSFCALAVAEAVYGYDAGATLGTATALVLCTAVAALAVRSANLDLTRALDDTERTIGSLSRTLLEVRGRAVELSEWRAHLVHDADNAVAGIRAALDVLDARQGASDPPAARLCRAAADEVRHLDHLLHRSADEPAAPFDVAAVVRRVAMTASALGQEVRYHGNRAMAVGRPNDLAVTLKNLLVNADRHARGSRVDLVVEPAPGEVRIVCRDQGPGVDPQISGQVFERGFRGPASGGSGLGLHEARMLMRAQGGDLVLEGDGPGACFVTTLPAAEPAPAWMIGIPTQRCGSSDDDATSSSRSAVR